MQINALHIIMHSQSVRLFDVFRTTKSTFKIILYYIVVTRREIDVIYIYINSLKSTGSAQVYGVDFIGSGWLLSYFWRNIEYLVITFCVHDCSNTMKWEYDVFRCIYVTDQFNKLRTFFFHNISRRKPIGDSIQFPRKSLSVRKQSLPSKFFFTDRITVFCPVLSWIKFGSRLSFLNISIYQTFCFVYGRYMCWVAMVKNKIYSEARENDFLRTFVFHTYRSGSVLFFFFAKLKYNIPNTIYGDMVFFINPEYRVVDQHVYNQDDL